MLLLVTGATGKVGTNLIAHLLAEPRWSGANVRALCHNRLFPETDRVEVVKATSRIEKILARQVASPIGHLAPARKYLRPSWT